MRLYGYISNDPINKSDLIGLIFDITYVRFDSLVGHAWIRTGEFVDVTINADPAAIIEIAGKKHRLFRLRASLPEGYGFYPAEQIDKSDLTDLFGLHKGKWIPEHDPRVGKEFMVARNNVQLLGWETEKLLTRTPKAGRFPEATFLYGKAKGSPDYHQSSACFSDLGHYLSQVVWHDTPKFNHKEYCHGQKHDPISKRCQCV